jgi:hypothetical protein
MSSKARDSRGDKLKAADRPAAEHPCGMKHRYTAVTDTGEL